MTKTDAKRGFTLIEIMFVVVLGAMISAIVLSAFGYFSRAAVEINGFRSSYASARNTLEFMAVDIRRSAKADIATPATLLLTAPIADRAQEIQYRLNNGKLLRRCDGREQIVCGKIDGMKVEFLGRDGRAAGDSGKPILLRITLAFHKTERSEPIGFTIVTAMRNADLR